MNVQTHFLSPFTRQRIPPAYRGAKVLPLLFDRRITRIIRPRDTAGLYQAWKDDKLELNSVPQTKVSLEVKVQIDGADYFYCYPIDLEYLFSPHWREDNLSSPFGFLRWGIEMDTALRLGMVKGYEGSRLGSSVLVCAFSRIRKIEGQACGYGRINLSLADTIVLNTTLDHLRNRGGIKKYRGNRRQAKLARLAGTRSLAVLHTALTNLVGADGRSWAEVLEYSKIELPAETNKTLLAELRKNWKKYVGNKKQVALAEKAGISHLGHLYSALSNLRNKEGKPWIDVLGYKRVNLPVAKAKALLQELKMNWREYIGNEKQVALAEKVGISHLGNLYSALSSFENEKGRAWAQALKYNVILLSATDLEKVLSELRANWRDYVGNPKQIALAEKTGISNLANLFSAVSNLMSDDGRYWADVLGWNLVGLTVRQYKLLFGELDEKWEGYIGNCRQVALARKAGISNLKHLFYALSSLEASAGESWKAKLGYKVLDVPAGKVAHFFEEWVDFVEGNDFVFKPFYREFQTLNPGECRQRFAQIKVNYNRVKEVVDAHRREDWPAGFYQYLLRTLPFLPRGEDPAAKAQEILEYIEREKDAIDMTIRDFKDEGEITYPALRQRFGELAIPVVKYYGRLYSVKRVIKDEIRELLYGNMDVMEGKINREAVEFLEGHPALTPLESLLLREEAELTGRLVTAKSLLSPGDYEIVRRIYECDEPQEEVARALGMAASDFEARLENILARIKSFLED